MEPITDSKNAVSSSTAEKVRLKHQNVLLVPKGRQFANTLVQAVKMELVTQPASQEDPAVQIGLKQTF